ncbi:MAG: hypothetical protein B7C24_14010 [Bacteroidetes bacterium 4572_77]|nr:MAG: hypothetical protein B7C24_14010 [Bacteroidetes bacterium 4572_77]
MEHKIWYDKTNDLVFLEYTNDFLRIDVEPILQKIQELFADSQRRQLVIMMSKTHKVENRETREESNKGLNKLGVTEIAFVGGSAANRMIARVLIKTGILKINGDFFKDNQSAIEWLKSKR